MIKKIILLVSMLCIIASSAFAKEGFKFKYNEMPDILPLNINITTDSSETIAKNLNGKLTKQEITKNTDQCWDKIETITFDKPISFEIKETGNTRIHHYKLKTNEITVKSDNIGCKIIEFKIPMSNYGEYKFTKDIIYYWLDDTYGYCTRKEGLIENNYLFSYWSNCSKKFLNKSISVYVPQYIPSEVNKDGNYNNNNYHLYLEYYSNNTNIKQNNKQNNKYKFLGKFSEEDFK